MTEFEQLTAAAYHAERVASRRLALKRSISEAQALRQTLELAAGASGLAHLLAHRQAQRAADAARCTALRQGKQEARALKLAQQQPPATSWLAWFDGSALPNPGRCGIGGVLHGPNGERHEICQDAGYGSSSDAEYRALIAVLEMALSLQVSPLLVYGDSQVVIVDALRAECAAAPSLQAHRRRAQELMAQLQQVSLRWIPRHKNAAADALSTVTTRRKLVLDVVNLTDDA